jgi:CheY-like chemotaxis protein
MDGYELARRLRSQPDNADAMLVALTGYGQHQDREQAEQAGFDHHLVKPADLNQVNEVLAQAEARRHVISR